MENILINQSVAILCDGNNIERSIHELSKTKNTMINFDKLIPKLLNGRGLNRLLYFREGKSISSKFADRLYENYYGSVIPCHNLPIFHFLSKQRNSLQRLTPLSLCQGIRILWIWFCI